ncbi:hypothetical protein DNTS_005864, partial [Danionella cerebrum]
MTLLSDNLIRLPLKCTGRKDEGCVNMSDGGEQSDPHKLQSSSCLKKPPGVSCAAISSPNDLID